jgi:ribose 5-phosphate isomerase RpiB
VLALSLRLTSEEVAKEILEAWLAEPYGGTEGQSLAVLSALDGGRQGS